MLKDLQTILDKLIDNHRRHKAWQKVVMVLACITVFCTTYALILPAITMETSPDVICGLEYNRPKMLRVKIFRNGELVKIITLTAEDNWTYEWTAPDDGSVWEVVSEEVSNYTITMWRNENHFITEYHTTGTSDDALSSAAESPIRGYSPGTGEDIDPLIAVVPMTISGMFLILFGILSRKRAQEDE